MKSERLDRRITIQEKTEGQSPSGEPVETWSTLVARRPASMSSVRGDERFKSPETVATEQVEFWVRYSSNIAELQPNLHRLIYPALDDGESADDIEDRRIFDILAVHEVGRREALKIITERNPDVTA